MTPAATGSLDSRPPDPARACRTAFHWALVGILLPIVSLPVVWGLALWSMLKLPRGRSWAWGTFTLALLDTVIAVFLWQIPDELTAPAPESSSYAIGVRRDERLQDSFVVSEVVAGYPAQAADLRVGDVILEADGGRVLSLEDLRRAVHEAGNSRPVVLRIVRQGSDHVVSVTPLLIVSESRPASGLFDVVLDFEGWLASTIMWFQGFLPFGIAFALLLLLSRGRVPGRMSAIVGAVIVLIAAADPLGALPVVLAAGGASLGSTLLGSAFRCLMMTVLGLLVMKRLTVGTSRPLSARLSRFRTFALGILYSTLTLRAAALVFLILGDAALSAPVGGWFAVPLSKAAWALLTLGVVLVGPIAEEIIFRGMLLGWLRSWCTDRWAVLLSAGLFALLHLSYGPGMIPVFVAGAVFGWARIQSAGLLVPILLHVSFNGLGTALSFL